MFKKILIIAVIGLLLFATLSCNNSQKAPSWIIGEWEAGMFKLEFSKTKATLFGLEFKNGKDGVSFENPSPNTFVISQTKNGVTVTFELEKINDTQIKFITMGEVIYTKKSSK